MFYNCNRNLNLSQNSNVLKMRHFWVTSEMTSFDPNIRPSQQRSKSSIIQFKPFCLRLQNLIIFSTYAISVAWFWAVCSWSRIFWNLPINSFVFGCMRPVFKLMLWAQPLIGWFSKSFDLIGSECHQASINLKTLLSHIEFLLTV